MSRSIVIAAALCLAWAGGAAGDDFQGSPVAEIVFSPPAQPVPAARLEQLLEVKTGAPLDAHALRRSIQAIFATGRYADVQVDAVRAPGGGVRLTFITVENWFTGQVTVTGAQPPPSQVQLIAATRLNLGEPYTQEKGEAGRQAMLRLLAENGFYNATVRWDTYANSDTQQLDIDYQVEPGRRAHFGEITLSGEPDLSAEEVRGLTGWSVGNTITQPAVQRGLEKLYRHYRKNDRLQAVARITGKKFVPSANRVDVALEINPGPRVEVALSGASLSSKQLRRYVPIFEEGTVDNDLLAEGARNLRDHFQVDGYFDAKIDYNQNPEENGVVLAEFQATLGSRHQLVRLDISGNHFFDRATIRERMYLRVKSVSFRRGRFSQGLLASDVSAIEELYHANGFLGVKVHTRLDDDYEGHVGDMALFIEIEEGPQTLIAELRLTGNTTISTESLTAQLNSVAGQSYSETNVASDRSLILGRYFQEGFPDAAFEWRVAPGPGPNAVILDYTIQEGRRQFVQAVITGGYNRTQDATVRREIYVYPSEPLSQAAILDSQRRLYDLGIFSQVNTAVQNPEGDEVSRNVLLQMEEARRWTVGVGGGAEIGRFGGSSTDLTSPAGNTGFSPRVSFELTRLNLLGRAYTGSLRTQFSTLQKRGLATFQAPRWRGRERLTLTFSSLYDTSRNINTFSARRLEGALQLQHKINKPSTFFYRYSYRRVSVSDVHITPSLVPRLTQAVRVGLLSVTYVQDRRDDPLDARRGIYNTVDLGLAAKQTGSEASFPRTVLQNSTYHRLTKRVVLARTTQAGAMVPYGNLREVRTTATDGSTLLTFTRDVPLPEKFFSGGASAHRGFSINQAGPRDLTTGFPLGGNALFLNSVELRFPVRGENVGGVLFHDFGNVFARLQDVSFRLHQRKEDLTDFNYMVHALGFGVRYRTPIGPVRLDLAYALNPPRFRGFQGTTDELLHGLGTSTQQRLSHFQFHFSLGQTF